MGQLRDAAMRLAPSLITAYFRATLLSGDARVTVDTDLQWRLTNGSAMAPGDLVMIETKSPSAATEVDRLLWRHRIRPVAVSKYATGLAALRPELPRNRWARVLRDHFASGLRVMEFAG